MGFNLVQVGGDVHGVLVRWAHLHGFMHSCWRSFGRYLVLGSEARIMQIRSSGETSYFVGHILATGHNECPLGDVLFLGSSKTGITSRPNCTCVSRDEHQQVQRYEGTYPWGAWDDEELPNS